MTVINLFLLLLFSSRSRYKRCSRRMKGKSTARRHNCIITLVYGNLIKISECEATLIKGREVGELAVSVVLCVEKVR